MQITDEAPVCESLPKKSLKNCVNPLNLPHLNTQQIKYKINNEENKQNIVSGPFNKKMT